MKPSDNCVLCNESIDQYFVPMKEWHIDGHLCGKWFYPGKHERVNLSEN